MPTAAQLRIGHCGIKDTTLASPPTPNQEYTDARLLPVRLLGNSSHRDAPWIVEPQGLVAQSLRVFMGHGLLGLFAPSSSLAAFLVSVGGLPGVWRCGSLPHPRTFPGLGPGPCLEVIGSQIGRLCSLGNIWQHLHTFWFSQLSRDDSLSGGRGDR